MQTFQSGRDTRHEILLKDANGATLIPTDLEYVLLAQDGSVVTGPTAVSIIAGSNKAIVTIAAEFNEIVELVEARTIRLTVTTSDGKVDIDEIYLLSRPNQLEVMRNSFQTLAQAHATAAMLPNLIGWGGSTDIERVTALRDAYLRLTRLGYFIRRPKAIDDQRVLSEYWDDRMIEPAFWPLITIELWQSSRYPEEFRQAMRNAQVVEANEILRGDRLNEKRRTGILSEKIGESAMSFRLTKPLELGISAAALGYLKGYLDRRVTITRLT